MPTDNITFLYLSELLNSPLIDESSQSVVGRVVDFAAAPGQVYPKITGIIAQLKNKKEPMYIAWSIVKKTSFRKNISISHLPLAIFNDQPSTENEILLKKSFLDKQLISTSGSKVVRVNDLQLLIDNSSKDNPNLWLVHIDIGIKGLLRRLGYAKICNVAFRWIIGRDIRDKFISWKYIQPTTTTNVYGALRLKTDPSKLSEIHPADLADIIEDLGIDERITLLESLDPKIAALTLQEIPLKIRVQIAETLDVEKFSHMVNEMQVDEAVDLMDELPKAQRNDILIKLSKDKVDELNELSKLSLFSVGSLMNTDFIVAKATATAADVLNIVKEECKKSELINYVYILDDDEHVKGVVNLRELLASGASTPIMDIAQEHVITTQIDANIKRVAQLFFKYNFVAMPVLDDDDRMRGIVTLRDALESVFPEMKEDEAT
mgnify:CR=1 FL=1